MKWLTLCLMTLPAWGQHKQCIYEMRDSPAHTPDTIVISWKVAAMPPHCSYELVRTQWGLPDQLIRLAVSSSVAQSVKVPLPSTGLVGLYWIRVLNGSNSLISVLGPLTVNAAPKKNH